MRGQLLKPKGSLPRQPVVSVCTLSHVVHRPSLPCRRRPTRLAASSELPYKVDASWEEAEALVASAPYESALPQQIEEQDVSQPSTSEKANIFSRAWSAYTSALETHPVLVKSATSFFGFLLGDVIAQTIVGLPYDPYRTLRLVLFGLFMDGPVGHLWYTTLDRMVYPDEPKSNKAVVAKMVVDQLIWAPFFSCIFFTFINTLEGHPEAIIPCIKNKLAPMMLANYCLWPLAHLINFKFVPSQQRILYINCVQIVWSAYLSNLAAQRGGRVTHHHYYPHSHTSCK